MGLNWGVMSSNGETRRRRSAVAPLLALALALSVGLAASRAPGGAPTAGAPAGEDSADRWREADRLAQEDKLAAALAVVEEILESARERGDSREWTRALVRAVQLRTALHGYETAVRTLRETPWPEPPLQRAILGLFYAQGLVAYQQAYAWEIAQREAVQSTGEVDLKSWTRDQIAAEAHRTYAEIWAGRESWQDRGLGELAEFLDQNDYPARIRGTLRDAVTYLWVELLADSGLWRPRHASQIYRLDRNTLIQGAPAGLAAAELGDPEVHPLLKIAGILGDLERWHQRRGGPEAAFEARLERLRRLHAALATDEDRQALREDLESRLEQLGPRYEWWTQGQATLAEFVRQESDPDALTRARDIALTGLRAHPESVGGRRCRHLVAVIEAPEFSLTSMRSDAARRRSILVTHRNIPRLHFRAYRLDLFARVESSRDYNLLPAHREVEQIVAQRSAATEWSLELPATPDFRSHRTFVTPDTDEPGLYLIVASARRDFAERRNRQSAVVLLIGDLVLICRKDPEELEVVARSGRNGERLPGAQIFLYHFDYRRGHRRVAGAITDADGEVRFERRPGRRERYFVMARLGEDVALDPQALSFLQEPKPAAHTSALIYTDRSVYRPLQKILWKLVAFRGGGPEARFETLAAQRVDIELVDPNGQVVESRTVTTNDHGSASGELPIPAGRLLGAWQLRSSLGGAATLRVEEYKRPTFEASLLEPESPLRLNRPAELLGSARYYFGLPVVEASVSWQVERVPIYPLWWWWGWPSRSPVGAEVVAAGDTQTDSAGRFRLTFVPAADEREAKRPAMTYNFRVSVEVTDEGGETRSAERIFRLGFVAIQALLEPERGFFIAGEPARFTLSRSDLDGAPRPGSGSWRLQRLRQPEEVLLPADQPLPPAPDAAGYATPGDRLRPRWETAADAFAVMRLWDAGEQIAAGEVDHDSAGSAKLELPTMPTGAYRLSYSTLDPFGARFETDRDFVVAADGEVPVALPALLLTERASVPVGEPIRLLVHSALIEQELVLELFRDGQRLERRFLSSNAGGRILELPVDASLRGGLGVRLTGLRDHQLMEFGETVFVPWQDRELEIGFESFRDRLEPGSRETWKVRVSGWKGERLAAGTAEVLAYMYDRSLDFFAPHSPPDVGSLYPARGGVGPLQSSLGVTHEVWSRDDDLQRIPEYPWLRGDRLKFFDSYGIGGPGIRGRLAAVQFSTAESPLLPEAAERPAEDRAALEAAPTLPSGAVSEPPPAASPATDEALRSDFSETAFWEPHLLIDVDGVVAFEFTVPDSVTEWNVWLHALTRDLRGGSRQRTTRTVKELMVRPYLPRFLREGDSAQLKVVVNNASEKVLSGTLDLEILDPATAESLAAEFGLAGGGSRSLPFRVEPAGSSSLEFSVVAPPRIGEAAFEVRAVAGAWSDGERRTLPLLPGRMHLSQSRFAALRDAESRELRFADLASDDDPTRRNERLVVSLDAQLFYGVLNALPYLATFPYECTEQTLNRFLSAGIVASLYDAYPAVAHMARQLAQRPTRYEPWDRLDPNRRMALEETPWLRIAAGGESTADELVNVLDPKVAEAERRAALAKLQQAQTALGGFPWWPGGPPSPHMTLYLLQGLSRALEFEVEVPKEMVVRAWQYMHRHYLDEMVERLVADDCCWELVTFLNYVLSSYADASWTGDLFTPDERDRMTAFSFRHWRRHSPLLKGYLALTLARAGRDADARLVFASVMDSARTTRDEGTFWAPEDRAWLWYNDTIETHAFALRTLAEVEPGDPRRHGLAQWLFLNKKLNHWKSTRATAEVIYSLVHYLESEGELGARQTASVRVGDRSERFDFEPDVYSGARNRLVLEGSEIDPATAATVEISQQTAGLMFASATWHFSTERLPEAARGDLFSVERRFLRRVRGGEGWILQPLAEGARLSIGDQLEVHLSVRSRHAAEYVHLRDPRAAGLEPIAQLSGYRSDLGIGWYEEIRDSGTNFFFEWLPAGEFTLKLRLRAAMAGAFQVAPAVLQSMYAPEFSAHSAGARLTIEP